MKKLLLLCTALVVLSPALRAEEYATVKFMSPGAMAEGVFGSMFGNMIASYVYFIEANGTCVGKIQFSQYVDVKLVPNTYKFVLYANANKNGLNFGNCTFERAKAEGMSIVYPDITVEAGQTYYIDISRQKRTLSNEKTYTKALEAGRLIRRDNEIQSPPMAEHTAIDNPVVAKHTQKPIGKNSKVDSNIPSSKTSNDNTYVLIIANEHYQELSPVTYAANDGLIFKDYCTKTLGIPETQVRYYPDASYGNMVGAVDWLTYALNNFPDAKAIVYYCGHGIPDEKTGQAYLIPVDGKGTNMKTCYSLQDLYKTLATTQAQSITYFMDACFTGANKEGSMLVAARGVARAPEKETLSGKTVVFSASSGDETAMTLKDEGHGLFTYYLLKKLQETAGDVTYGELAEYINQHVKKDAFLINEKPQTPVVATSPAIIDTWQQMTFK